jgi:hypothetical protein
LSCALCDRPRLIGQRVVKQHDVGSGQSASASRLASGWLSAAKALARPLDLPPRLRGSEVRVIVDSPRRETGAGQGVSRYEFGACLRWTREARRGRAPRDDGPLRTGQARRSRSRPLACRTDPLDYVEMATWTPRRSPKDTTIWSPRAPSRCPASTPTAASRPPRCGCYWTPKVCSARRLAKYRQKYLNLAARVGPSRPFRALADQPIPHAGGASSSRVGRRRPGALVHDRNGS